MRSIVLDLQNLQNLRNQNLNLNLTNLNLNLNPTKWKMITPTRPLLNIMLSSRTSKLSKALNPTKLLSRMDPDTEDCDDDMC